MPKSRPPYPEEFRREAVQFVRGGRKVADVAQSLGVTERATLKGAPVRPDGNEPNRPGPTAAPR